MSSSFKEINKIIYPFTREKPLRAKNNILKKYALTENEFNALMRDYTLFLKKELLKPAYTVYRLPVGDLIISRVSASTFISFLNTRSRALFVRLYKNRDKPLILMRVNRDIARTIAVSLYRLRSLLPRHVQTGIIEDDEPASTHAG